MFLLISASNFLFYDDLNSFSLSFYLKFLLITSLYDLSHEIQRVELICQNREIAFHSEPHLSEGISNQALIIWLLM